MNKFKRMLFLFLLLPVFPIIGIPDDSNSGDNNNNGNNDNNDNNNNDGNNNNNNNDNNGDNNNNQRKQIVFNSQEDLDKLVSSRINSAVRKAQKEKDDEYKKAQMTETERLKVEREEAIKNANDAITNANNLLIKAEAIRISTKLGLIDSEAAFLLMQKENIEVKDGIVKGVEDSLTQLIKEKPYLLNQNSNNNNNRAGDDQNSSNNNRNGNMNMNALIRRAAGLR
jgi:hypothetical protein